MDPWETLGVTRGATGDEIKRAWRKKAVQLHPDKGGSTRAFKECLAAYEKLVGRRRHSRPVTPHAGEPEPGDVPQHSEGPDAAWRSVPERIRFWFACFHFVNWACLYFAQPLFVGGGLLLLGGAIFGNPADKALVIRTASLAAGSGVLVVGYYVGWPRLRARLERKYTGRPIVEEPVLKSGRARAAPERRGKAAGVAIVLGGLLGSLSVGVAVNVPGLPLASALILGGYALALVIPMALLLRYAVWGTVRG